MGSSSANLEATDEAVGVLLIGGSSDDGQRVRAALAGAREMRFAFTQVPRNDETRPPACDVVLLEGDVRRPEDLTALAQARARFPTVPVVMLSDADDETSVLAALEAGARGYLVKAELAPRLAVTALAAALGSQQTIVKLNLARERERHLATHDQLTSLPNRMLFNDRLVQAVAGARRSGKKIAVLFADLDGFKRINDGLGHAVGDGVLRGIARQVDDVVRESDTPARVGGDEFAVLITQLADEVDAARVAEKLLHAIRKPVLFTPHSSPMSASIGIATFPRDGVDADDLVNKADVAMYHAKKKGGDRFEYYTDEMNAAVVRRVEIEKGLRQAIDRHEFTLFFQPQYDLRRGRISGAEALIRWKHPTRGILPPSEFLTLAEETGLIVPMGEWVLRTACAQGAAWHRKGHKHLRIAVNVAAQQFQTRGFAELVRSVVEEANIPPSTLELELTESSLLRDVELTVTTLRKLKDLGVTIAIDDFGTGYSSLAYLKRLSIDVLKVDQSFVQSLGKNPTDATITAAIINLARGLELSTVAEGVETLEQLLLLGSYGCGRMQGYLFGKPVPADVFGDWLVTPPFRWVNETAVAPQVE